MRDQPQNETIIIYGSETDLTNFTVYMQGCIGGKWHFIIIYETLLVNVQDVILGESEVGRVPIVVDRVAVEHGSHEVRVTGLVFDHVVF